MRILIVTNEIDRTERHLFAGLHAHGFALQVMSRPCPGADALASKGVDVQPIDIRGRLQADAIRAVRARLRADPSDIVYAPRSAALSVALFATRGLPCRVVGYRGTIGHVHFWNPGSWLTYLHPRVARLVCVSEAVRQHLLGFQIAPERLVTIHKGHDPAWYARRPDPEPVLPALPPGAFRLAFVGNMRPVKGVHVLLRAMAELPPESPVHLLLIGEARDRRIRRLMQHPACRGRVHALGYRDNAWAWAGRCDAFIMPSIEREGLPRAVIEAMAQGVPAVVTRVGGMPELVRDGLDGLVIAPRSSAAIGAAVQRLASDRAAARGMGQRARERVETAFNIARTLQKYAAMFAGLA